MVRIFRKRQEHLQKDWRTIGITGTGPGVGITHFSVQYANYLSGVAHKKTAVLEWNQNGDLERMEAVCCNEVSAKKSFIVQNVTYYKCAGAEELAECIGKNFECIVIDFGWEACHRLDFLRCSSNIVMVSLSEWQLKACLEFFGGGMDKQKKSWQYYTVFGSEESRRELEKTFGISLKRVPFSEDAFTITGEAMEFYAKV